jgi:hypothetical protein
MRVLVRYPGGGTLVGLWGTTVAPNLIIICIDGGTWTTIGTGVHREKYPDDYGDVDPDDVARYGRYDPLRRYVELDEETLKRLRALGYVR